MISTVKITEVKANPNNPRTIKDEKFKKLVESIKGFPEMLSLRPIVVNDDMVVLGGNMRLKACKEAGLKEVPIIKASDLSEEQQKEFIIKDNIGFGDWDWQTLSNEWDFEQLQDWGLDVPDFAETELDDLSEQIQPTFRIEVLCKDEEHQEKTYNKLIADGHECKLLTL